MGACDPRPVSCCHAVDADVDVDVDVGAFDPVLSGVRRRWLFSGFEARGGENGMGS